MRGALVCLWLLVPAVVAAYHYGPGQQRMLLDDAARYLKQADAQAAAEHWGEACESYDAALAALPGDNIDAGNIDAARRVRLERAKAQMLSSQLPEAYDGLVALSDELTADKQAPAELVTGTRTAMANAQYYMTWLMRLEGRPRDEWEPVIEASRQNYRLLAEDAQQRGDTASGTKHSEDLEAAIRLARMDLADLQALPLPSQCKKCKSGNCHCLCKKKSNKVKTGKSDARGASSGPPPDDAGS